MKTNEINKIVYITIEAHDKKTITAERCAEVEATLVAVLKSLAWSKVSVNAVPR